MRVVVLMMMLIVGLKSYGESKMIHVFVALCDNENQGIVPVSKTLGDGQNPNTNLYWGAMYGVKSYFNRIAPNWQLVETYSKDSLVLEAVMFKHKTKDVYMFAEAYDGAHIKQCIIDFLQATKGMFKKQIINDSDTLDFGGEADLVSFIGHDGLMDFILPVDSSANQGDEKEAIILACYSKMYFKEHLKESNAQPLLWSTHLMAPVAYVLEAAITAWLSDKTDAEVREAAAQAYNKYQRCGINGARNLLVTGY